MASRKSNRRNAKSAAAPATFAKRIHGEMMTWLLAMEQAETDSLWIAASIELIEDCRQAFDQERDTLHVRASLAARREELCGKGPTDLVMTHSVDHLARMTATYLDTNYPGAREQVAAAMARRA